MARIRLDEGEGGTCGVAAAVSVIDGKWKTTLLWLLESGPHRPGALRRKVPGISEKVLTQALREMEEDGLVHRETHDVVPPKTVYSLTEQGLALSLVLAPLSDWGHGHLDRLAEARRAAS
ncbi:winged helix-turn-helix transcriptional regulator [Streptomyces sp. NPDC056503]|uniref:winged helix-turn-helix transcriptional regulator n=1 Tax=Streptomyces sp. NPDC056503 TaxID=3345842 RepID=UPI0036AB95CB